MTYDLALRTLAGLAAVAILCTPAVAAVVVKAREWCATIQPTEKAAGTSISDMRTVLDLASRLRACGNTSGVHLCQQLLDVMLAVPEETK